MEGNTLYKREELLEACHDLRLPVAGNESVKTLEFYIQAAYDDFDTHSNQFPETYEGNYDIKEEEIDLGRIGDKSWRIKYILNKILFFL
jgi:hypothetical protein